MMPFELKWSSSFPCIPKKEWEEEALVAICLQTGKLERDFSLMRGKVKGSFRNCFNH